MEVQITSNEKNGKAFLGEDQSPLAEMTFTWAGSDKIIINHTEGSDALKGKSAGNKMLMALVEKAKEEGFKIMPLCPFARSVFQKAASIKDIWF